MSQKTAFPKLLSKSKRQSVFDAIKGSIASGVLMPGQRLVENDLAHQMNVGTPTIREALIDLEHSGFVTRSPNRGTFVTKLTADETRQIYVVREALEVLAVRFARRQASSNDINILRGWLEVMRKATYSVDRYAFYEADLSFHRAMWELSKNPFLIKTLEHVVAPLIADVFTKHSSDSESLREVVDSHEKLVNCLTVETDEEAVEVIRTAMEAFQSSDRKMDDRQPNLAASGESK